MVAHFRDGGHYFEVMSKAEVDSIRKRSKASDRGPWVTDYEAMAKKTVVRRAFPYLPVSVESALDVAADETTPVAVDDEGVALFADEIEAPEAETEVEGDVEDVPEGVDPETGEVR